ncbi:MAG TPA: hypothetical protein VHR43_08375 [Gemmatimonadales bacterium]|jgi:hypothetical protein|nr:hypothetical protein [Gemmatimonadales bacterium]
MMAARLLALLVLLGASTALAAPPRQADSTSLEFHGFRAGASLADLDALVRRYAGRTLRCDRAKADPHVSECRAVVRHPSLGPSVNVWISAIDSTAGVITLSTTMAADQLDRWRQTIERRYGRVDAQVQGPQWMMQWVRRGRMMRLTWRVERGGRAASVSLVDGRVLDTWGRTRSKGRR